MNLFGALFVLCSLPLAAKLTFPDTPEEGVGDANIPNMEPGALDLLKWKRGVRRAAGSYGHQVVQIPIPSLVQKFKKYSSSCSADSRVKTHFWFHDLAAEF